MSDAAATEPVAGSRPDDEGGIRLGLSANLGQFSLLVAVNALVGGMVGQERAVLPLLATEVFGLQALTTALTFIVAFGLVKAATNFLAGALADRFGRKPVLVAGWLIGLPVPLLLIWAPSWEWVVLANALLGVNQGLTWSTTVITRIDLAGPAQRGLAMGFNEAAGYGAVALTAFATGLIAEGWGLRPGPFLLGLAFAGLGLTLSTLFVKETRGHARYEAASLLASGSPSLPEGLSLRRVFVLTSFRERALSAASQAGLVNNLNDGLAWGLLPLYYAAAGLSLAEIGLLAALYPAVWGLGQLLTGALSDPEWAQAPHRRRDAPPGAGHRAHRSDARLRPVGHGLPAPGGRDGDGLSGPARGDRRCRASVVARVGGRRLPALARRRVRRRSTRRRVDRRPPRDAGRDLGGRGTHRSLRARRRRACTRPTPWRARSGRRRQPESRDSYPVSAVALRPEPWDAKNGQTRPRARDAQRHPLGPLC